ncbi:MAG: methyltransferase [Zetaproteobacteria bacterium CG12_big_fil_rev_8_21_14_0_65_55_1124]|nr:MAG: hypothetical protein AUJ58_03200 [Zetaproteobacteria bacterium CG1_02_55_237]PIS19472.1 MAG: methyltransferase [Zetaproteobacteria bacterium CG08_land_8_20_14_0_20_55_17]PIW42306.1 MAG: methyltransferase [Zetaproteobacteria bacterium CG12_big_fil_rev_8_21_14_0_65_55_1124]PIY52540.1 MAG: methyltransferase [Zetaproteobacteria bacterium CG_4_10_14_0_8_um_filter_55_43]PIZ36914.1 MAG: methyltransferase [Zetaproteobacteria bacterium CG_4_10_14_0_2_um_filter_55_20]PJB80072.1 MAG: methyltransf
MAIYRRFQDGMPWYLARYYWWAYLWDKSIWFFDHQPIINAILFGNYRKLQAMTLPHVTTNPMHQVLQLTCVYGELTGKLLERLPQGMFIADACVDQLKLALRKTANRPNPLHATRLNAESLSYADNSFDQIIVFFLFHEMPHDARERCIAEIARTLRPGGSLILTEYAPLPEKHLLYRFPLTRWIISRLEPFLPDFWRHNVRASLEHSLQQHGKSLGAEIHADCFASFYRVTSFTIK